MAAKDVSLATEMGRKLRVPLAMANTAQQRYIEAQNAGLGQRASGAVALVQEGIAGVEVRV